MRVTSPSFGRASVQRQLQDVTAKSNGDFMRVQSLVVSEMRIFFR